MTMWLEAAFQGVIVATTPCPRQVPCPVFPLTSLSGSSPGGDSQFFLQIFPFSIPSTSEHLFDAVIVLPHFAGMCHTESLRVQRIRQEQKNPFIVRTNAIGPLVFALKRLDCTVYMLSITTCLNRLVPIYVLQITLGDCVCG